ncbi:MAG TPA: serine/threonine-protein kinase, partial [Pyrinomonadaceae bacterium]|nr:serine/threonine-protein kinase [Pyrinomonadaceae bacterium]
MKPEDWALIEGLFNEALELDVSLREPFLREKEDAQPEIIAEVRKLLKSNEKSSTFLDSPAFYQFSLSQPNEQSGNYAGNEADQYTDIFLGRRFGVYRLVEQIGRGGMGAVYRAFRDDGEFKHQVAVKLLKRGMDTDFIIQRFKNERQILASFDHPFIARLIDGGTTIEGLPYFVMEFIEGKNIYDFCDENRYSIRERLETFLKVCSAVEYAHSLGVVHRDIKPGNILVTSTGLPKLLDFGIAKILDPSLAHDTVNPTGSMLRLMTPDYASPEQIRGINITTSSDIYSLGVLLYELLTGHKPFNFEGLALHEITKTVCEEIPVIPGAVFNFPERLLRNYKGRLSNVIECRQTKLEELVSELSGPLGEIIMRPLQKDPSERYADVKEFSNEIQKYLRGDRFTAFSTLALIEKSTSISAALESIAVLPFKVIDFSGNGTTEYKYLEIG